MANFLSDQPGEETVTIIVGTERQNFSIDKKLICEAAGFFNKKFADSNTLEFPEDCAGAITLFIEWLYHGIIATVPTLEDNARQFANALFDLYILTQKFNLGTTFADKVAFKTSMQNINSS